MLRSLIRLELVFIQCGRGASSTPPHGLSSPRTLVEEVVIFFPNVCLCQFAQHLGAVPLHGSVSGSSILVYCSVTSKPFYDS